MHLNHLSLHNFRNFTRLDVEVPAGQVLILGDNAQGKTSLLEAVYYLATFVSFHASGDRQLINFLAAREPLSVARIVGEFTRGTEEHRLEVRIIQEPASGNGGPRLRKEALMDGVKHKVSDVVGQFNAVLFLPQMMRVMEGSPDERRRYMNLAISQVIHGYAEDLATYTRTISQRNALLKQLSERGGDQSQLEYWDDQLVTSGAPIIRARIAAVQDLERQAARVHRELTHGSEVLRVCYHPSYDPLALPPGQFALPVDAPTDRSRITVEQIRLGFLEKLRRIRSEEISRGLTLLGPHRDELRFLSNGVDLGTYGSRGQIRTAMLSMKLAEVGWMKDRTGHWPVLLLDEVMAELDIQRRNDLLHRLEQSEQALLTTTDMDLFSEDFSLRATQWRIKGGRMEAVKKSEDGE